MFYCKLKPVSESMHMGVIIPDQFVFDEWYSFYFKIFLHKFIFAKLIIGFTISATAIVANITYQ